ncbi:MAG: dTMP kinase [bacterium]|nr:dTMP kinase [bacterium]
MAKGIFITFEGGEGAGKSTQCALLAEHFIAQGREVILLREPGSTAIGEKIRSILLDIDNAEMSPIAELLLYEAARTQMVAEVVIPALEQGKVVICDRFFDSTVAYQGYGRELGPEMVRALNEIACQGVVPDRTILMERNIEEGLTSAKRKGSDRIEAESLEFHEKVRAAFETMADEMPDRIRRVTMREDPNETFALILDQIADLL